MAVPVVARLLAMLSITQAAQEILQALHRHKEATVVVPQVLAQLIPLVVAAGLLLLVQLVEQLAVQVAQEQHQAFLEVQ